MLGLVLASESIRIELNDDGLFDYLRQDPDYLGSAGARICRLESTLSRV